MHTVMVCDCLKHKETNDNLQRHQKWCKTQYCHIKNIIQKIEVKNYKYGKLGLPEHAIRNKTLGQVVISTE